MDNKKINQRIKLFAVMAVVLLAAHYLLDLRILDPWAKYLPFIRRLTMSSFIIALIFLVSNVISRVVNTQTHIEGNMYNLMRVVRFLAITFSLVVAMSFLFQNLYAAAVSFGLITLILGFALQQPITSFIAWIYLIFRRTYLVGDRIQIKGMRRGVHHLPRHFNLGMQRRLFGKRPQKRTHHQLSQQFGAPGGGD